MGARLRYAKVIDTERLSRSGGTIKPGLDSAVCLSALAPAAAAPFVVMRSWDRVEGAFSETWRIVDPHGMTVHEPMTRELVPGVTDVVDEIADTHFEYADDAYQLVLEVDGEEVARAGFAVLEPTEG